MLLGILRVLDACQVPYCLTHSFHELPERITSDVDCVVAADVSPERLAAMFQRHQAQLIPGRLIRWHNGLFVFGGRAPGAAPAYVALDCARHCTAGGLRLYAGSEVIASRRRHGCFWVASAEIEFGCTLLRRITKGLLRGSHERRLTELYRQDPAGCGRQIRRFLGEAGAKEVESAAATGEWQPVRARTRQLQSRLRRRLMVSAPWRTLHGLLESASHRAALLRMPRRGFIVAFLGPDGAGKSSVIAALSTQLADAFSHTARHGFAPGILHALLGRPHTTNSEPHAAQPRSRPISVFRALVYWLPYYAVLYRLMVRFALARSTLVLHDRHLIDALVDPLRYRYVGSSYLLQFIWRFVPKPDLIVVLDAPADVLQARKQEVILEETVRQRAEYLSLARALPNGIVINANRPLALVVQEVSDLVLRHLAERVARSLPVLP
jgi:thymidylate kinase